jgi:hypothetical protein
VICRETSEITARRARQNLALARAARAGTHATIDTDAVDLILTAGIAAVPAAVGVLELRGKRLFAGLDAFVRNLGRGAAGREWSDSPIRWWQVVRGWSFLALALLVIVIAMSAAIS